MRVVPELVPLKGRRDQAAHLRVVRHVGGHRQRAVEFRAQRGQPIGPASGEDRPRRRRAVLTRWPRRYRRRRR
jgi:hypothetical protein